MNRFRNLPLSIALFLSLITAVTAQDVGRLDESFRAVAQFEYGKDAARLNFLEQLALESASQPALRADLEKRMVAGLNAPGTRDGKEFICRQLAIIGTSNAVPALESLLTDPGLSHMARFALVRIPDVSASTALKRTLQKTSGALKAGLLNSLAARKDSGSLNEILTIIEDTDEVVATAALAAVGELGGADAIEPLLMAKLHASEQVRRIINNSLLKIAEVLQLQGKTQEALRIYEPLFAQTNSNPVRVAALSGLLRVQPETAPQILSSALRDNDPLLRACAVELSKSVPGGKVTQALADLLDKGAPDTQILLVEALAVRPGPEATPAIALATRSTDPEFRSAVFRALGNSGQASYVPLLLQVAANGTGPERESAEMSLVQISNPDVALLLIQALSSNDQGIAKQAIKTLGMRRDAEAFRPLLALTTHPDTGIRQSTIRSLAAVTNAKLLGEYLKLCQDLKAPADGSLAFEQLQLPLSRIPDAEQRASALLVAYATGNEDNRTAILPYLANTGQPAALKLIRESLDSTNPNVAEEAVRALADWPDVQPASELLEIARTAKTARVRVVALRGYVRMAGSSTNSSVMFARGMEVAQRPEDKKAVLGSMGSTGPAEALAIIEPCLHIDELRLEAASAIIQIANRNRQKDASQLGTALRKVIAVTGDTPLQEQARNALNELTPFEGHILQWMVAGPYRQEEKDAHAIFGVAFAPEERGAEVKWTRLTRGVGAWDLVLNESLSPTDDVAAYLKTRVWSPTARPARLEIGSDDGVKVWLNEEVVHSNDIERGLSPRQDIVKVNLNSGWNELMLKVLNRAGGWAASCRIRQADGSAMDDLKIEPK